MGRGCICWFHLQLRRSGGWMLQLCFGVLPRREGTSELVGARVFNKRLHFLRSGCVPQALLSAGLGGEGEEGTGGAAPAWRWSPGSSISATSTAASKRWRFVADAIFGQRNGPASLDQICSSFFLICWRILGPGAAESDPNSDAPSGFVPGGDRIACIWWLGGGAQGLARVSRVNMRSCRVQSRIIRGLCAHNGAAQALSVKLYPPPV